MSCGTLILTILIYLLLLCYPKVSYVFVFIEFIEEIMSNPRNSERGQALVEYGLVLVLVAVAIIAILTLFGDSIKQTYCRTTYALTPDADLSTACQAPIIMPIAKRNGNGLNLEAKLHDPDGDPDNPYAEIVKVEFYIDDEGGSPVIVEDEFRYCLGDGNGNSSGCTSSYDISGLSSGQHSVIILAHDSDGNVGRARYRFTK